MAFLVLLTAHQRFIKMVLRRRGEFIRLLVRTTGKVASFVEPVIPRTGKNDICHNETIPKGKEIA